MSAADIHFAGGSTTQPTVYGGASAAHGAPRAVNSPPQAIISEQTVRCSHCGQFTDGDCGEFRCPFSLSMHAEQNPGVRPSLSSGVRRE